MGKVRRVQSGGKKKKRRKKKTSAMRMNEERAEKIETGQKRQTENCFCHPQHGCR